MGGGKRAEFLNTGVEGGDLERMGLSRKRQREPPTGSPPPCPRGRTQ